MRLAFLVFLLGAGLAACDSTTDSATRPVPVPEAAFTLGAGAFPAPRSAARSEALVGLNFVTAAARVGIVTAVVGANLILPREATRVAAQAAPTESGGVYTWASTATVAGGVYNLALVGAPRGETVDWRLEVDPPNGAAFDLYTATTSLDGKTGSWTLYADGTTTPALRADYDVRAAPEVTFSVPQGRFAGGSSVRYLTEATVQTFDWLQQPEGVRQTIQWDTATHAGSITAANWNGGARSCWNADLNDVNCR